MSAIYLHNDLDAYLLRNWLESDLADKYYNELMTLDWQTERLSMFGKSIIVPRKIAWFADGGLNYRYSGVDHIGQPMPNSLEWIKARLQDDNIGEFNACLANLYSTGNDYMGWHSDNEPSLGVRPTIASVSIGEARDFVFKHQNSSQKISIKLYHGDLLVMFGNSQEDWRHALPKRKKVVNPRINLTYRRLISP